MINISKKETYTDTQDDYIFENINGKPTLKRYDKESGFTINISFNENCESCTPYVKDVLRDIILKKL